MLYSNGIIFLISYNFEPDFFHQRPNHILLQFEQRVNMISPASTQQYSLVQLRHELQVKLARLKREVDGHNATRTLLMHTQNNAHYWEHQAVSWQAHVQFLESKLSVAEGRCQQLSTENGRLHLVVKHLVRGIPLDKRGSKSD